MNHTYVMQKQKGELYCNHSKAFPLNLHTKFKESLSSLAPSKGPKGYKKTHPSIDTDERRQYVSMK